MVPAKKKGCPLRAKFCPMVWMKPGGLELLIPPPRTAKTADAESTRDASGKLEKRIMGRGVPERWEGGKPTVISRPHLFLHEITF